REFSDQDQKGAPNVIIINESMAQHFFPRHDVVGRAFKFSLHDKDSYQIIGIVADTRDIQLNAKPRPEIYFPILQVGGTNSGSWYAALLIQQRSAMCCGTLCGRWIRTSRCGKSKP